MNYVQKIGKIRKQGQLTVPAEIREALEWKEDEVIVKLETIEDGFKVEKLPIANPQQPKKKLTEKQWERIRQNMKRISRMGKKGVNLTEFLRHDRATRE